MIDSHDLMQRLEVKCEELGRARHMLSEAQDRLDRIAHPLPTGNLAYLFEAMLTGRKIEAIKEYRTITGWGLKESKDQVERIMGRFAP